MGKGITGEGAPPAGAAGGGGGNWIRSTGLKEDKEFEIIRFLLDHSEFFWERFHKKFEIVNGERKFRGWRLCLSSFLGQACEPCSNQDKPGQMWMTWIYESDHFFTGPGQGREEVEKAGRKYFRQEVNAIRLMRYSTAHLGTVQVRVEDLGTLLNHEFRWTRSGVKDTQRPSYLLDPLKEVPLSDELIATIETLPELEQVALGKVESLSGEQKEDFGTREVAEPEAKQETTEAPVAVTTPAAPEEASDDDPAPTDDGEGLENPF